MIEVRNLTKHYGDKKAVNDISFTVNDGEILGFLGPNGAGKSTTMNMLTGYISSTSGQALINGVDILEDPIKAKSYIGYLPEIPPLYVDMTVHSYLNFVFDLKKCKLPRRSHMKDVMTLCKIQDVENRLIKNLSKGYKQRVGLAQALINNPPVLILDEPTVGLDPKQIIEIRTLIKRLGKNHTVILSSHILSEIQAVCQRVIIINRGKIIADDTAKNLSAKLSSERSIVARIMCDESTMLETLKTINGVKSVTSLASMEKGSFDFLIEPDDDADIRADVFDRVVSMGKKMLSFKDNTMSLEQVFLRLTEADDDELERLIGTTADKETKSEGDEE